MKTSNPTRISVLCGLLLFSFFATAQQLETSVFVTANTGTADNNNVLSQINEEAKTLKDSKLLILGNAVSKDGYSREAKTKIISQLDILKSFNGKVVFTPGHHEWVVDGHRDVRDIEKFIQKKSKAKFYPDEGCPIKKNGYHR